MSSKNSKVKVPAKVLIDSRPMQLQLIEGKTPGRMTVRGEFARCDVATENKRVYPGTLWEKQIKRLKGSLSERKVLGEADHPGDGQTKLQRVSHLITDLVIENGVVVGEAEILDTEQGKNLQAMLKAGVKVGVSSRGYGSTVENDKGDQIVQDDYVLRTFDFVVDPADTSAYPEIVSESKELAEGKKVLFEGVDTMTAEQEAEMTDKFTATVLAARKEEQEKTRGSMRDEMTQFVLDAIAKNKAEMEEQIRSELLSDPSVAAAKAAVETIKAAIMPLLLPEETKGLVAKKEEEIAALKKQMAESDLRLKAVEADNLRLAETARKLGFQLHVERTFAGNGEIEKARTLVGDVAAFKNAAELKARVQVVSEEIASNQKTQSLTENAKLVEANKLVEAKLAEVSGKFEKVVEALNKSMSATTLLQEQITALEEDRDSLELSLYAEKQLTNNPKAAKIRTLIEASHVKSKEDIDRIVESVRGPAFHTDELDNVRSRIRGMVGGGHSPRPLDEETPAPRPERGNGEVGISLHDFRTLSGIPAKNTR